MPQRKYYPQVMAIRQQLDSGIRALDINMRWTNGRWRIVLNTDVTAFDPRVTPAPTIQSWMVSPLSLTDVLKVRTMTCAWPSTRVHACSQVEVYTAGHVARARAPVLAEICVAVALPFKL